ncbi:MAG: LuxR C-terminal-related transcriptional regulator [Intrasporangium sp.]|uniref:helix-turn-helix transcriptional regulator n=1 Tax=Intrasporangium sp. TaxID=1925024 RepID=UPI002649DE7E|nr:LuxR C-terminal-related transcriptional regulator [Intrasporangium sp.]MDN5797896.1 LuxR C-terminal-related transcriptional regulator [Intrasporangium sp.]
MQLLPLSDLPAAGRLPAVLVVEDGEQASEVLPSIREPSRCVAIGSVGSLPMLLSLAERGSFVLNAAAPFVELIRLVDEALRQVRSGRSPNPGSADRLRHRAAEVRALGHLTPWEALVLEALMDGASAVEIAERTSRSLHTVRSHIKAVLSKLGVSSQVAAVGVAERSGAFTRLDVTRATFGAASRATGPVGPPGGGHRGAAGRVAP